MFMLKVTEAGYDHYYRLTIDAPLWGTHANIRNSVYASYF